MDGSEEWTTSLWIHVAALRRTVVWMLSFIAVSALLCFVNYDYLLSVLQIPLVDSNGLPRLKLVLLSPLEGIVSVMRISFWTGVVVSSPLWIWSLMRFISPGLHDRERRLTISFLMTSLAFIVIGGAFAFFVTIPLANQYLLAFNQGIGINLWSLERYLDYTLFLILANAIAFECGAIGIFAVRLGVVTAETLSAKRRHAILGAFILATILTPPDVLTQLMLAIPLIALYEGLIIYAKFKTSERDPLSSD